MGDPEIFILFESRQIGDDETDVALSFCLQRAEGEIGRDDPFRPVEQSRFKLRAVRLQQLLETLSKREVDVLLKREPDQALERGADELGQATVGIEHDAGRVERRGALVHLLHHHTVRLLGALEGVDAGSFRRFHEKAVDAACTDGVEKLFRFLVLRTEGVQLGL
jgi:hypothetical protein